jgi:hypothetical protein
MRTWLVAAVLLILPLIVYWPTVSHEYGFRDDYAHLREVRERPGWLMQLTTSNGRPVYGLVLEASLRDVYQVTELEALRLASTLLIAVVGLLLWWHLRRSGWSEEQAAALGIAATLLPGAQIVVGWAIAWPIALGLVAAVAGFALIDRGLERQGPGSALGLAAGCALYFAAGLTYQTSALFVLMPLAAVLLLRDAKKGESDTRWTMVHLTAMFGCLFAGFLLMTLVFTDGVVPEAARMQIEPHPFIKLLWFLRNPLPNSIALFALRDSYATPLWFWIVVAAVVAVAVLGFVFGAQDARRRWRWVFAALLLPFVAHSVSLAASSQAIGYRTLLPLSGLYLVLFVFGFRAIAARVRLLRYAEVAALGALVVVGAFLARHNALTLLAEPQGNEWRLVQTAVNRLPLGRETRVYIVRPTMDYRSTERVYADEFGSLSSDAQWGAVEMFRAAVRQRFPQGLPDGTTYTLTTSFSPPIGPYDLVLDLRELKNQGARARAPRETTASRR